MTECNDQDELQKVSDLNAFSDDDLENAGEILMEAKKIMADSGLMKSIKQYFLKKETEVKSIQDIREIYNNMVEPKTQNENKVTIPKVATKVRAKL